MASSLQIITAPHPSLRRPATPVERVDTKLRRFVDGLSDALRHHHQPRGVGLAAPQVNQSWRVFATQLPVEIDRELDAGEIEIVSSSDAKPDSKTKLSSGAVNEEQVANKASSQTKSQAEKYPLAITVYLNPRITDRSDQLTFGPDPEEPRYEGCLSIPKLYGPVPRWTWIELEYQQLEADRLVTKEVRAEDFRARVLQHELDHLDGVLFTDYSLKHGLPVFQLNPDTDQLEELIDRSILEVL